MPHPDGLLDRDAAFVALVLVENVRVDVIVMEDDAAVVAESVGE